MRIIAFIFLISFNTYGQEVEWLMHSNGYQNRSKHISVGTGGHIYVTGSYEGLYYEIDTITVPYLSTGNEMYLTQFNPQGRALWTKFASGVYNDLGISTASIPNVEGTYWASGFISHNLILDDYSLVNTSGIDAFITKINDNGEIIWLTQIEGTGNTSLYDIASSNTLIAGGGGYSGGNISLNSTLYDSEGLNDIFIFALDTSGEYLWSKTFGTSWNEHISGLTVLDDNKIIVTGEFSGDSLQMDDYTLYGEGSKSTFIAAFDSLGTIQWINTYKANDHVSIQSLASKNSDHIIAVGDFRSDTLITAVDTLLNQSISTGWAVELDGDGNEIWTIAIGVETNAWAKSVTISANNSIIISGDFGDSLVINDTWYYSNGANDLFILSINLEDKSLDYASTFGGSNYEFSKGLASDKVGNVYWIADYFSPSWSLETYPLTTNFDGYEFFVAQIGNNPGNSVPEISLNNEFIIYPTIFENELIIVDDFKGKTSITVYNSMGELVMNHVLIELQSPHTIYTNSFTPGIYLISVCDDTGCSTKKVMKL